MSGEVGVEGKSERGAIGGVRVLYVCVWASVVSVVWVRQGGEEPLALLRSSPPMSATAATDNTRNLERVPKQDATR